MLLPFFTISHNVNVHTVSISLGSLTGKSSIRESPTWSGFFFFSWTSASVAEPHLLMHKCSSRPAEQTSWWCSSHNFPHPTINMVYGRKKRSSRLSLRSWLVHKHLARITSKPPLDLFPLLFRHIIHLRGDIHLLGLPEYRVVIVNEAAAVYQIQVTKRVCDMNMQHHNLAMLLQKLLKKCNIA